jgi:parallel beta-helix repeat protein
MSINSKLIVDDYQTSESIFSNFYYGLRADGTSSALHFLSVSNSEFIGNKYGIKCGNLLAPKIILNSFDDSNYHSDETGIYFSDCNQYAVEQNEFFDIEYGAYIRNSGVNYNKLYNNDFDGVKYPAVANLVNSDFVYGGNPGETGLEIKCNDFDYFDYAISVTGNMRKNQGIYNNGTPGLAGNIFDNSNLTGTDDYEFAVDDYITQSLAIPQYYYYHHITPLCIPDKSSVSEVTLDDPYYATYSSSDCPDSYGTKSKSANVYSIAGLIAESDSLSLQISNKENELLQIVDDGNTLLLTAKAAMMSDANYLETIAALDQDGMISDDVVLEIMQNTQAPQTAKTSALINNSPLPKAGKDKIDEMTDVDETLRYILKQYQNGVNTREQKENEILRLKNQKDKIIPVLLDVVIAENNDLTTDSVINYFLSQANINDYKYALRLTITNQNYHDAENLLSELMYESQGLDINEQNEIENYVQLQAIAFNIDQNSDLLDSIVFANQEFLMIMAQDTLVPDCEQAQCMLEFAGLGIWNPVVYPPNVNNQKSLYLDNHNVNDLDQKDYLKIYPNPTKENLFVEYAVLNFDNFTNNSFNIYTEKGEFIKKVNIVQPVGLLTLNIRNFTPGIYLVKLNNTTVKFTKM